MHYNARVLKHRASMLDIEDSRTTTRRRLALSLLEAAGLTRTIEHGTHWSNEGYDPYGGLGARCVTRHECNDYCIVTWDEWATDEMFEAAWALADLTQTFRGIHHRQQAWASKSAS